MKKYLIYFIIFFSIFLFSNNVKALSQYKVIFDYDNSFLNEQILTDTNLSFINDTLIPYLESASSRSQFDYNIFINTSSSFTGTYSNIPVWIMFYQKFPSSRDLSVAAYVRSGYTSSLSYARTTLVNSDTGLFESNWNFNRYCFTFTSSEVLNKNLSKLDDFLNDPSTYWVTSGEHAGPDSAFNYLGGFFGPGFNYFVYKNSDITLYNSVNTNPYSSLFYYASKTPKLSFSSSNTSNLAYAREINVKFNDETFEYHMGDDFPTYYDFINDTNSVEISKVLELDDGSFAFYNNFLNVSLTSLSGTPDILSILCEQDKPFNNGYCNLNYQDMISKNSDISYFNNFGASFTQLFGSNSGYLIDGNYYLYSFRILKPFTPNVGNLFINTLSGTSYQIPQEDFLGVYLYDGGSYTDYVIKFKLTNSGFSSSSSLNDIMIVFRDGLSNYYSTIPSSFSFSVYRSFKLKYFTNEPTSTDIDSFLNNNDLSSIDGVSNNNSFFTDTNFDTFGFGGIITAPFRILYALEEYESCSDIDLPFPYSNNNISLKCVRQNIPSSINPLIVILQTILSGIICYRIAVGVLNIIKELSDPDNANIEVVDL